VEATDGEPVFEYEPSSVAGWFDFDSLENGKRIPGLKLDQPRQLPRRWEYRTDQYTLGSLRYDMSKLRAKGLVRKCFHRGRPLVPALRVVPPPNHPNTVQPSPMAGLLPGRIPSGKANQIQNRWNVLLLTCVSADGEEDSMGAREELIPSVFGGIVSERTFLYHW